jgi:hypothetical protein
MYVTSTHKQSIVKVTATDTFKEVAHVTIPAWVVCGKLCGHCEKEATLCGEARSAMCVAVLTDMARTDAERLIFHEECYQLAKSEEPPPMPF